MSISANPNDYFAKSTLLGFIMLTFLVVASQFWYDTIRKALVPLIVRDPDTWHLFTASLVVSFLFLFIMEFIIRQPITILI